MQVWRLTSAPHAAPTGEGARLYGGRWNKKGTAVIYTAGSESLAILEYLVHVDSDLIPTNAVILTATIPDTLTIHTIHADTLPEGWRECRDHPSLQTIGTDWLLRRSTVVLRVPSAIARTEFNYLLNPSHADFHAVTWSDPIPYQFDPRLLADQR